MGKCTAGCSKTILLFANTLIFIIAAGALGVVAYIFFDEVGKALTKVSLLTVVGIVSLSLMVFALLGCKAAVTPPQRKCSKCMYLTILLVLFLAEFAAAGVIFNVKNSLQVLKDHHFDVESDVDKATVSTLHFLHDQLNDFYNDQNCSGGAASLNKSLPLSFTAVQCPSKPAEDAFHAILQDKIDTAKAYATYEKCYKDPAFTPAGKAPSDFTQAFCGSEANIVSLAQKYDRYLVWFPVALAGLTLLLLIATICLIAQKDQDRRRRVRLQGGVQPIHAQMAGP